MFDANLGFRVSKIENSEEILAEFASFKANYPVNGRGDWPLVYGRGNLIFYHFPTKLENLPDHVDSSPTGKMAPTLMWCHPCSYDDQSPHLFDFPWSSSRAQILQCKQKTFGALLSLAVEFLPLFTFEFRVLQVSHKRTQINHVNQWRTDLLLHALTEG